MNTTSYESPHYTDFSGLLYFQPLRTKFSFQHNVLKLPHCRLTPLNGKPSFTHTARMFAYIRVVLYWVVRRMYKSTF